MSDNQRYQLRNLRVGWAAPTSRPQLNAFTSRGALVGWPWPAEEKHERAHDQHSQHQDLELVDERDDGREGHEPRVLFYLEHALQDAGLTRAGERRVVSKRMLYVELDAQGTLRHVHYAPYLDYRPLAEGEPRVDAILARPECAWIGSGLEQKAQGYAVAQVVPEHLHEVRGAKLKLLAKTEAAVKDRLTKEITY